MSYDEVRALRDENERLKRQMTAAGLFNPPSIPPPRSKAPGVIWALCPRSACRFLARYPRTPGTRLARTPCQKCGATLGHGANIAALRRIAKHKPRSRIARIADNLELGWRAARDRRRGGGK